MKVVLEHDDDFATIEVYPDQKLARLTWKSHVSSEHYRSLLMCLLDVVSEQDIKLWLSDGRKMGPILQADQVWTRQEFTPDLIAVGLERIAIVSSLDAMNVIAVDKMVNATPKEATYSINFFEDPAIAQLWLMESNGAGPSRAKNGLV